MLIDFLIICKRQVFIQFQFSLKKKLLSRDSYKAKGMHYKSGKYISNIIRLLILKLKLWYLLLLRKSCVK